MKVSIFETKPKTLLPASCSSYPSWISCFSCPSSPCRPAFPPPPPLRTCVGPSLPSSCRPPPPPRGTLDSLPFLRFLGGLLLLPGSPLIPRGPALVSGGLPVRPGVRLLLCFLRGPGAPPDHPTLHLRLPPAAAAPLLLRRGVLLFAFLPGARLHLGFGLLLWRGPPPVTGIESLLADIGCRPSRGSPLGPHILLLAAAAAPLVVVAL